ncbi:MAG TPA: aminoacyl-tRNA hydrolase [Candidatus Saccharimonadales bacterium]|nr:aminoacyl-tRNA hydrolase [Candidatus Saccharimonadales bacterium]
MKLVIGLGNIGAHFDGTRHNVGFAVVEAIATAQGWEWLSREKFKATVAEGILHGEKVILAKPNTYYNVSGEAARAIRDFYKIANSDIVVVHDELALPFGTVRTRGSGSDAGNNGIKSIIAHMGDDVARIRVGIANEHLANYDAADYVLSRLNAPEQQQWSDVLRETLTLLHDFIDPNKKFGHTSVRIGQEQK